MRVKACYPTLLCFLFLFSQATAQELREVEFEWAASQRATIYEIKISPIENSELSPTVLRSQDTKMQTRLLPGAYHLQTRSLDNRGVPGGWSEASPLWVPIPAPELRSPEDAVKLESDEEHTATVEFSWTPVTGAHAYLVDVFDEREQLVTSARSEKLQVRIKLAVAKAYKWRVRPLGYEDSEGDPSEGLRSFTLYGSAPAPVVIKQPASWYVRKLEWEKPKFFENFQYRLQYRDEKSGRWVRVSEHRSYSKEHLDFLAHYPGGQYRFDVRATAALRQSSSFQRIEFGVVAGDRSPASEHNSILLASFDKPSNFYVIASYLITMMDYTSSNVDEGYTIAYDAIGGTGRMGIGYQPAQSNFGAFGILDQSGISINDENLTFTSAEFHGVYQTYYKRARWRFGSGLYYKELPETLGSSSQGLETDSLAAIGLHGGAELWLPMSLRTGLQFKSQVYYPMIKSHTPNDLDIVPALSYQLGLMGSYKLTDSSVGFLGYVYRLDQLGYKSANSLVPGESVNDVSIDGHYLNLLLEWAF